MVTKTDNPPIEFTRQAVMVCLEEPNCPIRVNTAGETTLVAAHSVGPSASASGNFYVAATLKIGDDTLGVGGYVSMTDGQPYFAEVIVHLNGKLAFRQRCSFGEDGTPAPWDHFE